jgi:hypothetical protein
VKGGKHDEHSKSGEKPGEFHAYFLSAAILSDEKEKVKLNTEK